MRIDLYDGKYTYVCNDDGSDQHALRYGERWRDLVGDGFVLAMAQKIEELEQAQPKWISVEDELPEIDWQNVLVYCDGGNIQTTKYHSDRNYFRWEKANCYSRKNQGKFSGHFALCHESGYKITHWMPLPQPPEVK